MLRKVVARLLIGVGTGVEEASDLIWLAGDFVVAAGSRLLPPAAKPPKVVVHIFGDTRVAREQLKQVAEGLDRLQHSGRVGHG